MMPLLSDCLWFLSSSLIIARSAELSLLEAWGLKSVSYTRTYGNSRKLLLWYVNMEYSATQRILLWYELLFFFREYEAGCNTGGFFLDDN